MKYPYIGKSRVSNTTILFTSRSKGVCLNVDNAQYHNSWDESVFKNITREYLASAKVKIESEEHSHLIQELAFKHGYVWIDGLSKNIELSSGYIVFDKESMTIIHTVNASYSAYKKITLPLPPKGRESKEWPVVGDEVLTASEQKGQVIAIDSGEAWIKYENTSIGKGYASVSVATLSKPKTPEEELRDELKEIIDAAMSSPFGFLDDTDKKLVDYMLDNYNITKKPQ